MLSVIFMVVVDRFFIVTLPVLVFSFVYYAIMRYDDEGNHKGEGFDGSAANRARNALDGCLAKSAPGNRSRLRDNAPPWRRAETGARADSDDVESVAGVLFRQSTPIPFIAGPCNGGQHPQQHEQRNPYRMDFWGRAWQIEKLDGRRLCEFNLLPSVARAPPLTLVLGAPGDGLYGNRRDGRGVALQAGCHERVLAGTR